MSNPFGDSDDDEAETSESNIINAPANVSANKLTNGQMKRSSQNESFFDESFIQQNDDSKSNLDVSNLSPYRFVQRKKPSDGDDNSISRQSIASNSSEMAMIGSYSLGDGNFQKEGLLCPECLQEFKTITELMNHSQSKHVTNSSLSSSNGTSSIVFDAGLPSQMGVQIKGLLNKIIKQNKVGSNLTDIDTKGAVDDIRLDSNAIQTRRNPIKDWKLYMNKCKFCLFLFFQNNSFPF